VTSDLPGQPAAGPAAESLEAAPDQVRSRPEEERDSEPPTRQLSVRYLRRMLGPDAVPGPVPGSGAEPARELTKDPESAASRAVTARWRRPATTRKHAVSHQVPAGPGPQAAADHGRRRSPVIAAGRWLQDLIAAVRSDRWTQGYIAALGLLAVLVQLRAAWTAEALLLLALLTLPGLLLLRALRIPAKAIRSFPGYVPAASLVVLLGAGLVVDLLGPRLGIAEPLRPEPMLVGVELSCLGLLAAGVRAGPDCALSWRLPTGPGRYAWALLLLPLVAAAGAERLNNGYGGAVAIVAVIGCAAVLVGALVFAGRLDGGVLTATLLATGLALMWAFSLRGDLVYGFDISAEYHAMQQTIAAGVWHTAHVGDAYGGLLSVTVLPAGLHALTGLSGLMVLKLAYPLLTAFFPVAVFGIAGRVLDRRWAFAAAALVMVQETFFQQLPGLARQEISLVLFAVLVAAILDDLPRRSQLALVTLLSLAMVVSHYSTTYFALIMLAIALALQWAISWIRDVPRFSPAVAVAVVVVAACGGVWYGLVTRSASNLSQFVSAAEGQGFDLLPSGGNLIARYLQAGSSVAVSAAQYAREVHAYYAAHIPYVHPLPDAGDPGYALQNAPGAGPPVRWQLGLTLMSKGQLIIVQLMNLLAGLGALALVLRRDTPARVRQLGLLGLACLVILAALRFSGTAATAYNPERAFLQGLVVLAITICWVLQWLASAEAVRRRAIVLAATAAAVAVILFNTSSLAGAVFGGGTATNLANSGADYDQFAMTTPELAAARWLATAARPGELIYADRYAQLRMITVVGNRSAMLSDVTPLTLDQGAWVYADRTNVVERTGLAYFNGQSAAFAFPFGFLDANFDLVYSNGTSQVFFR
jgi:uncharacterized membrane protein